LRETGKPIRSILLLLLTTAMFLSAAPDQAALVTYGNLPLAFASHRLFVVGFLGVFASLGGIIIPISARSQKKTIWKILKVSWQSSRAV
jgi:hypothetical protein